MASRRQLQRAGRNGSKPQKQSLRQARAKSPRIVHDRVAEPLGPEAVYALTVPRFLSAATEATTPGSTVLVVSKGDRQLLGLSDRTAWHFPQNRSGEYTGYYPGDSVAAIAHLETLRRKGAQFLVFPQAAFWWLQHYHAFRQHLVEHYRLVRCEPEVCAVFALDHGRASRQDGDGLRLEDFIPLAQSGGETSRVRDAVYYLNGAARRPMQIADHVEPRLLEEVRRLFDLPYYSRQAGEFDSMDTALLHYLETGHETGYNPHPLFDSRYYASHWMGPDAAGMNPLVHYLVHSVSAQHNPNPLFDTEFYYKLQPQLRPQGINALLHYLEFANQGKAGRPNPLFCDRYYLENNADIRNAGLNPLAHYIAHGCAESRYASYLHWQIVNVLLGEPTRHLLRGNWRVRTVLMFADGATQAEVARTMKVAETLAREFHLRCPVIFRTLPGEMPREYHGLDYVVLEDYRFEHEVYRLSAMNQLVKSLRPILKPVAAIGSNFQAAGVLEDERSPQIYLGERRITSYPKPLLEATFSRLPRSVFQSNEDLNAVAAALGRCPERASLLAYSEEATTEYCAGLLNLLKPDCPQLGDALACDGRRGRTATNRIVIPCSDWRVSGVNSAMEAIGLELIRLGWDVRIVFTHDEASVARSVGDSSRMPKIPYSYLQPERPGLEATWAALLSHLESQAPCIMFMSYDFAANGVAPALTEKVGVVAWSQSDDRDYYEQVYRLGRYCNAIVCVSDHIRKTVTELNPAIGSRAVVIHNTSVSEKQIAAKKPVRSRRLRLIYTGRLVQYQKRILDVIRVAESLDRLRVPYVINLAGEFSCREKTEAAFREAARAHLRDGRIRLLGRMRCEDLLEELSKNDFFLLLSEFEGLPLSVLEAMARGCVPAVAEMESGIPELVSHGENGLVLQGRDYDQWARAIVEAWGDSDRLASMSQHARDTVRQRFTVEHVARQFAELFSRIAGELCDGSYRRPVSLNWGATRSPFGDVLPPPSHLCIAPPYKPKGR